MRVFGVLALCLVLAGCGGSSIETCTAKFTGPNGQKQTVVTEVTGSITAKDGICQGDYATEDELLKAMFDTPAQAASAKPVLPDVAGVPQSVTTKTDGKVVTETYTYGTPRPKKTSKKTAPAAPKATPSYSGVPSCSLKMVGGAGYACAND